MEGRKEGCWEGRRGVGKEGGVLGRKEGCWEERRGAGKEGGVLRVEGTFMPVRNPLT